MVLDQRPCYYQFSYSSDGGRAGVWTAICQTSRPKKGFCHSSVKVKKPRGVGKVVRLQGSFHGIFKTQGPLHFNERLKGEISCLEQSPLKLAKTKLLHFHIYE